MKTARLLFLGAVCGLAGCTTMTSQERRAADEQTCKDYGFRAGSEAFAGCLLDLELDRRAAQRAAAARFDAFRDPIIVYRSVPVRPRPHPSD